MASRPDEHWRSRLAEAEAARLFTCRETSVGGPVHPSLKRRAVEVCKREGVTMRALLSVGLEMAVERFEVGQEGENHGDSVG